MRLFIGVDFPNKVKREIAFSIKSITPVPESHSGNGVDENGFEKLAFGTAKSHVAATPLYAGFRSITKVRKEKPTVATAWSFTSQFHQVSWIKDENLHITLKFLGNVKTKRNLKSQEVSIIHNIKKGIKRSVEGIKPFELEFNKLGYFDRTQLIIWLGIKKRKEFSQMVDKFEKNMLILGFEKERRRLFIPHITIGRGKHLSKGVKSKIIDIIKREDIFIPPKPVIVSEITLFKSSLKPTGAIYTPLFKLSL